MAFAQAGPIREFVRERAGTLDVVAQLQSLQAEVTRLRQEMDELRTERFPPIVYETEIAARVESAIAPVRGQVNTLVAQMNEIRAEGFAPIVYEKELNARIQGWFDTSLGTVLPRIQAGLTPWLEGALNTYTNYLATTSLFDDGFASSRWSLRGLANAAGRFSFPFTGLDSPFDLLTAGERWEFNLLRQSFEGMRNRFANVHADFRTLRDGFGYLKAAMDHGIVITGYAERMHALFHALFIGGTWNVAVRNFLGQVVYQSPTISFNGMGPNFDGMRSHMNDSGARFAGVRDRIANFRNAARPRLGFRGGA